MSNLQAQRKIAFERQSGRCYYCEQPMWENDVAAFARKCGMKIRRARRFQASAEHLIARCDGGKNDASNIVAAHIYCNQHRHKAKAPLAPAAFRRKVRRALAAGRWHCWRATTTTPLLLRLETGL